MHRRGTSRRGTICSFLDTGTSLTGELHFEGTLRIDGNFQGSIKTPGTLVVSSEAVVDGDISAREVQIFGRVLGTIDGDQRVEIREGGTLQGEARTPSLVIEEGAKFEGVSRTVPDSGQDKIQPEPEGRSSTEREIEHKESQEVLHEPALRNLTGWAQFKSNIQHVLASWSSTTH